MLPKVDKSKKNSRPSQQLDLVESISNEDKVKKKRLTLYLAIILTVGLSLVFWTYRFVRGYLNKPFPIFSVASVKVPKIILPNNQGFQTLLDSDLDSIIGGSKFPWNISVISKKNSSIYYNWSGNSSTPDLSHIQQSYNELSKTKNGNTDIATLALPQGLEIKESILSQDQTIRHLSLIKLPSQDIYISVDTSVSNPNFKDDLPNIITKIYWNVVNSD